MSSYLQRVLDNVLDDVGPDLPAVALEGPKAVGKSETLSRRATTVFDLDDPPTTELLINDSELIDRVPGPVLIDEWQKYPTIWDRVRRSVDRRPQPGRFLLAGSAAPSESSTHSGAGRIVRLRMRPLSWAERDRNVTTVSLAALLDGEPSIAGESTIRLTDYIEEIAASGFPAIRRMASRSRRLELDSYIAQIVEREFAELGVKVRRPDTLRGWLRSYSAAVGSTASYNAILDAATPGEASKPSKRTTMVYRDVLSQLWLLDPVTAWSPSDNLFTRFAAAPKHYLADPAMTLRLLDLREEDLLAGSRIPGTIGPQSGGLLGRLFESLIALSLQTYVQMSEAQLGHLRTRNGDHEVDFIVSRGTKIIAIEVKLSPTVSDNDVRHLHWLGQQIGDRLADSIVITTGANAYRRHDGVAVVPAALLGP